MPGRYPGALGWLGGHILFADFYANVSRRRDEREQGRRKERGRRGGGGGEDDDLIQILVRGCYLGLLSHRIALGHYVGVGGEYHVRARIGT